MLVSTPDELSSTVTRMAPARVAVAYVGTHWKNYLCMSALKEIIVSPTLGSSPYALKELLTLSDQHGFDVFFQKNLHAKLFISEHACLLGSANLSKNGFEGGLMELDAYLEGVESVQQAITVFETFKKEAITDREIQNDMVEALILPWQRAYREGLDSYSSNLEPRLNRLLNDWIIGVERVWMAWIFLEPVEFDQDKIQEALPEAADNRLEDYFEKYTVIADNDDVAEGDWLLVWHARKRDGHPIKRQNCKPFWLRVDKLIERGAHDEDDGYTTLAVMLPGNDSNTGAPFSLDNDAIELIKTMLAGSEYAALRWQSDEALWRFQEVTATNDAFLVDLQKRYRVISH